jgi:hypothetical protein
VDKTEDDAKVFGLVLPKTQDDKSATTFEVWDENWDTVMMFLRMQTQWNTTMAGYLGLKYEVLLMSGGLFDLYSVEDRLEMLEGLQTMEAAALSVLAKSDEQEDK